LLNVYVGTPFEEAHPKAEAAAIKGLQLDETLAEAHTSLARISFYRSDWSGTEKEFKRAVELNPSYATAHHWYGQYLSALGRHAEAIEEAKRARELDPLSPIITTDLGSSFYWARRYDEAIEQFRKVIELEPSFFWAHLRLCQALVQNGMFEEGFIVCERAITLSERSRYSLGMLGFAYAMAGRRVAALQVLNEMEKERERGLIFKAIIYSGLGQKDEAIALLERAYAKHGALTFIKVDPKFDPLRSEPRFQDLVRRMNFPE